MKPATTKALNSLSAMQASIALVRASAGMDDVLLEKPADGFTVQDYSDSFGVAGRTARDQIGRAVSKGVIREVRVLLPVQDGRMVPLKVYVPVKDVQR